uniref:Elongin-C n=1 Tax=Cucumis melo TaxID=3656 RepID=A0A9I9DN19_CUCME
MLPWFLKRFEICLLPQGFVLLLSFSCIGNFAESQHREVTFPEISTTILEKICQYFHWNLQFASGKETEFPIEPELTLELMMAANYLHT